MTRRTGRLTQWDDAKGYGFITPDAPGRPKLFVHVQAFGPRAQRPVVGEVLSYVEAHDAQGKLRAQQVRAVAPRAPASARRARDGSRVLLWVPAFAALVLAVRLVWGVPNFVWGAYTAMSLATFIVYALDKRAARRGDWRVAENTLHGLALLCGWPGALLAQELLRHKSVKPAFRRVFWLMAAVNVLAFVLLTTPLLHAAWQLAA